MTSKTLFTLPSGSVRSMESMISAGVGLLASVGDFCACSGPVSVSALRRATRRREGLKSRSMRWGLTKRLDIESFI